MGPLGEKIRREEARDWNEFPEVRELFALDFPVPDNAEPVAKPAGLRISLRRRRCVKLDRTCSALSVDPALRNAYGTELQPASLHKTVPEQDETSVNASLQCIIET
jgi:hypothetical protein